MTEWGVVGVLIALTGFIAAVVRPIVSLTRSITELSVVVRGLRADMDDQKQSAHETHRRLWQREEEQDRRLSAHEQRIGALEGKGGNK